jgi:hypothetical protein
MTSLGDVTTSLLNIFNVRLPRRITVRLGDLDLVFDPVGTVLGKKQRLQALGYYYEQISGAAAGNAVTEGYTNCLAAWRAKREGALAASFGSDAAFESDMQDSVRNFVLDGNALPPVGAEVKVRLPGALTFSDDTVLGAGAAADGSPLPSRRFNDETAFWNAHGFLGQIPITFKVEKLQGGSWIPAPSEFVHVQLIAPFYDDIANELADVNAQRAAGQRPPNPPTPGGPPTANGIQQFLTKAMNFSFGPGDPQRYNAHQSRGGKRGLAVLKNLLDAIPAAKFPGLNAPTGSPHDSAVKVQTNGTGDGGILFLPSRMAGDRYRLRFFVDPNAGFASDGTEKDAVMFETGRFAVWRHVLWSNFLPKGAPTYPTLNSVRGVQHRLAVLGYDTGPVDGIEGPLTRAAVSAFQSNNPQNNVPPLVANGHWYSAATQAALDQTVSQYLVGGGPTYTSGIGPDLAAFQFATAIAQFQVMYSELEIAPAIIAGQTLTAAQYQDALQWAIATAQSKLATYGLTTPRDVAAMFSPEFQTPFLWDIRHPQQYNRMRGAVFPAAVAGASTNFDNYWLDADSIIYSTDGLLELFMRYILGGASAANPPTPNLTRLSTPGINVLAAIATSRLFSAPAEINQVVPFNGPNGSSQNTGIAIRERAATVYGGVTTYTGWIYQGDGFTKNTLHEIGHTLYLRHQYTGNTNAAGVQIWTHAGANFCEDHDSPAANANPIAVPDQVPYDRCLMGYLPCDGDFCGKCHLKLRGWDIAQLPV